MGVEKNNKINDYIDSVCTQVEFHEAHDEIRLELENHIVELAEEHMNFGLSESEAIDKSIAQMGDAAVVGKQLNKVHMPKPEWSILFLTFILSGIGILVNYFIQANGSGNSQSYTAWSTIISFFGFFILIGLYFFNYRKIKSISIYIFFASNLLLLLIEIYSDKLGYSILEREVFFGIPFLLILSIAGIFDGWDWTRTSNKIKAIFMLVFPALLLMVYPSFSAAFIYSAAFMAVAVISGLKIRYVFLTLAAGAGFLILILITGPMYRLNRFLAFLKPYSDPNGAGYVYRLIHDTLVLAKPFGAPGAFNPLNIPGRNTEFIFTYIICAFGWAAGIFLAIMFAAYIIRIIRSAVIVKDSYGRLLVSGFAAIFAVRFLWNIPMALGIGPIIGISLPFVSYGRIDYLVNAAAIGLILSVYRRKNISIFEANN